MAKIQECGRSIGGGTVAVDIEWQGELSGSSIAWVVTISSSDGSEHVRLVHERSGDGSSDAAEGVQYVERDGSRHEVGDDADVHDDHITARFPLDTVGVAADWPVWKAALHSDGSPVDEAVIPTI